MFDNRSKHMIRSKDELKRQLLMALPRNSQSLQQPPKIQIKQLNSDSSHSTANRVSDNSYSILDEFSKCPYIEAEEQVERKSVLNMFMNPGHHNKQDTNYALLDLYTKKLKKGVEASAQTTQHCEMRNSSISPYAFNKTQNVSTEHFSNTPIKQAHKTDICDKKSEEKSIINVSNNLSNHKYIPSCKKSENQENKVLTESIFQSQYKPQPEIRKIAQQRGKQEVQFQNVNLFEQRNNENEQICNKPPLVRKINLSSKAKGQVEIISQKDAQKAVESDLKDTSYSRIERQRKTQMEIQIRNMKRFQEQIRQQQEDEDLKRILSKKSSIKDLIKQKSSSSSEREIVKWEKKQYKEGKSKDSLPDESEQVSDKNLEDIMDLFPPYESSSSTLEAVIQQQDSQMEESVQTNKHNNLNINQKMTIPEPIRQISMKKQSSSNRTSQLQQISLQDLSLQDVSQIQIQNRSEDKNFMNKSSLKKIPSQKKQNRSCSKNLFEKQYSEKLEEEKIELEKFICNDIVKDIEVLKRKIQSDIDQSQDFFQLKNKSHSSQADTLKKNIQNVRKKSEQFVGSSGKSGKQHSMLDFFQKINNEFDFQEISKDIIELRYKMESDSSGF